MNEVTIIGAANIVTPDARSALLSRGRQSQSPYRRAVKNDGELAFDGNKVHKSRETHGVR